MSISHPAKFADNLLPVLASIVNTYGFKQILDPFAGTGKIFELEGLCPGVAISALELEPEWAHMRPKTLVGNALQLPFANDSFDAIITSPCFANRLADDYEAKDGSVRHSYRFDLGRKLHPANAGSLRWGEAYREFHIAALREMLRVAPWLVLNIKNHIRGGQEMLVTEWWIEAAGQLGYLPQTKWEIATPGLRYGRNHQARIAYENIIIFRRISN